MAERQVSFIIGANIKNFTSGLKTAQSKFKKFGRTMQRTGRSLTRNISAPLGALAGLSLKAAADFETLEQSLSILNGSAEEGARIFENLKSFAAGTPFQLQDIANAQKTLQGFGLDADTAFESIKQIGDISAVVGGNIQNIAIAFGQAGAEGRLMSKDIRQLINNGVPAIKLLSNTLGVAEDQIFDMASEGKISFEILQQAFRDATSEGGQFADGAQKQSQTLNGLFSTLRDNVTMALAEIGNSLVETFNLKEVMADAIEGIQSFVKGFQNLSKETKRNILIIAAALGSAGPLAIAIGTLSIVISTLFSPITALIALFLGVVAVGQNLVDNWSFFSAKLKQFWTGLKVVSWEMVEAIVESYAWMFDMILNILQKAAIATGQTGLAASIGGVRILMEEGVDSVRDATKAAHQEFNKATVEVSNAREEWVSFGESIKNAGKNALGFLKNVTGLELPTVGGTDTTGGGAKKPNPFKGSGNPIEQTAGGFKTVGESINSVLTPSLQKASSEFNTIQEAMNKTIDGTRSFSDELANNLVPMISEALGNATGDFLEMAITAAATGGSLENVFRTVLLSLADLAIRVGKIAIATGIAIKGIKEALKSLNPIAAIAAGAALIALGAIVKGRLSKTADAAGMAQGGIVPPGFPNDSFPAMLTSGETVLPSPKSLPSGMGTGNEQSMYKAFKRALNDSSLKASGGDLRLVINNSGQTYR